MLDNEEAVVGAMQEAMLDSNMATDDGNQLYICQIAAYFVFILMCLFAKRIVNSASAFYTGGALFGALASILITAYLIKKVIPKVAILLRFKLSSFYYLFRYFSVMQIQTIKRCKFQKKTIVDYRPSKNIFLFKPLYILEYQINFFVSIYKIHNCPKNVVIQIICNIIN